MKKILKFVIALIVKIFLSIFLILTLWLIWLDQNRSFYCLDNNKCITVWKRIGGSCFVIPGKYYGVIKPSDNYILTTNTSMLDIIWEKEPSHIIVSKDETSEIKNNSRDKIHIEDYQVKKEHYDSIYTFFDGRILRYKKETVFMSLFIVDNYATDSSGNKL